MLGFFRKYQRYFFLFITVVIVFSFSFFGTFSTFAREEKREDVVVAHTVDGSSLMLSEIQDLTRFISSDREDPFQYGTMPNFCNDGVVRNDLIRTGLADVLSTFYFDEIREEVQTKLDRAKRFRPYVHPGLPFLNAEAVWEQFIPALKNELRGLQEEGEATPKTFSHLCRLYSHQSFLPPEMLKRILLFQHQRLGMRMDPQLQGGDLSLFGFHSLSDWFGHNYLTLASEFILNAAAMAETKGFQVSMEEAKGDLLLQFQTSLAKFPEDSRPSISYVEHLKSLGFNEKSAAAVWRKVLLFRKYFQGVGRATFVDRLPFKDFATYAHETATVAQYQWPSALRLKTFDDLIQLQYYLMAVAPKPSHPLDLPDSIYPVETIEKNYPELVQASFKAKVKELNLQEAALRATMKEVWDWELDLKNWGPLQAKFSFLPQGTTKEERFQALENLESSKRLSVDSFARSMILKEHPEWIEEALSMHPGSEQIISISKSCTTLANIEKPWALQKLLSLAIEDGMRAKKELERYSDNSNTVYQIDEVELLKEPHLLTLQEAKLQNILTTIAERNLSAAYPKIRIAMPETFQLKNGSWKLFVEVKNEVAKVVFKELFDAISKQDGFESIAQDSSNRDDLYAMYRLFAAAKLARLNLQKTPDDPKWVAKNSDLMDQFKLERNEVPVQRISQEKWMQDKPFTMLPNEWSPIWVPPQGDLSFFYLVDKKPNVEEVLDKIANGQELIVADAQKYLAEKLLDSIIKNHSIVLPKEPK